MWSFGLSLSPERRSNLTSIAQSQLGEIPKHTSHFCLLPGYGTEVECARYFSGLRDTNSPRIKDSATDSEWGPMPGLKLTFDRIFLAMGSLASTARSAAANSQASSASGRSIDHGSSLT